MEAPTGSIAALLPCLVAHCESNGAVMKAGPAVVVLAAGKSSRFAATRHKLAQPLGNTTVLEATLRHAVASHLAVVVVTTQAFADVARHHVAARDVVVLPEVGSAGHASLGMGYSIAA